MNARHARPLAEAISAGREEDQLETIVSVVGGEEAQRAVTQHRLCDLIEEINGHA